MLTRLAGRPLLEVSADLDRSALVELYREVGALAAAIHRVVQDAFGYLVTEIVDSVPTNARYMARQFDRLLREFREAGGDAALARRVEGRVRGSDGILAECRTAALCHNDLHEGNLLVEETDGRWRLCGLVDVENAVAADPLLDLAKTDCYSIRGDAAIFAALLAGYGPVGPRADERLALYRIHHTLELWDWFHEVGQHEHLAGLSHRLATLSGP